MLKNFDHVCIRIIDYFGQTVMDKDRGGFLVLVGYCLGQMSKKEKMEKDIRQETEQFKVTLD